MQILRYILRLFPAVHVTAHAPYTVLSVEHGSNAWDRLKKVGKHAIEKVAQL
jgi:hypothetical protein